MTDDVRKIFLITPIGAPGSPTRKRSDQVKRHLVEPAFPGYDIQRSDLDVNPGSISHQIIQCIHAADLVIVDMSDHNPNVFYEMAIAHGYRKAVVHMCKSDEKIPFDVTDMRTIMYNLSDPDLVTEARRLVQDYGEAAMRDPQSIRTPISQADAFVKNADSGDPEAMVLGALSDQVVQLSRDVRGLQHLFIRRAEPMEPDETRDLPMSSILKELESLLASDGVDPEMRQEARRLLKLILSTSDREQRHRYFNRAYRFLQRVPDLDSRVAEESNSE